MILYLLFIAHCLADFTFQPAELYKKKPNSFAYLMYHALVHAAVLLIAIFPFVKFENAIFPYVIIVSSHFIIDWIKSNADKKFNKKATIFTIFITDQIIHISIVAILCYIFNIGEKTTKLYSFIHQWTYSNNLVIYCLIFVILWDPAAVFIKKLLTYIIDGNSCAQETYLIDGNSCAQEENDPQAGRIIGKLERIIISVLVLINQFGAIGFVLTAKSIARYKQLEDKKFAERYLVGTLTSVLIAFTVTIILKQFLN